jgi:type 1 glutamine amidotransferase
MAMLDRKLRALPIRAQDVAARCARYEPDATAPLAIERGRPAVLVFEKSNGFRDGPSVDAATAALKRIGERRGWQMVFTSRAGDFTAANLRQFDAVIWNNVSGDALTLRQRAAFRSHIERGGGFAGFHGSGGDPVYWWDWYADTLIGARFRSHVAEHQVGRLQVEGDSAVTRGIAPGWSLKEEWYSFHKSPRGPGTRVLVTLDEASYDPRDAQGDIRMGDHPIAWTRCLRDGRSFYSAIGHRPEVYADPRNVTLMEQGVAWAMGLGETHCRAGREIARRTR